jgi:chromosome segregation protein
LKKIKKYVEELKEEGGDMEDMKEMKKVVRGQYIVEEVVKGVEEEIEVVEKMVEELSQPVGEVVLKEKEKEITERQKEMESLMEMRAEIVGLAHFELEIERIEDAIVSVRKELKRDGYEGYTYEMYTKLLDQLNKLKMEYRECENEYEEERKLRDEMQEQISTLQFESNSLNDRKLKITQRDACLVEFVKAMNSLESDIHSLRAEIKEREQKLAQTKALVAQRISEKESKMVEITSKKVKMSQKWKNVSENYSESGRLLKSISVENLSVEDFTQFKAKLQSTITLESTTSAQIEQLEKALDASKKEISEIAGGDIRVDMLRKGRKLHNEIKSIDEDLRKKCKNEEEIKLMKETKARLSEEFNELKDRFNRQNGYNIRLSDDLKSIKLDLKDPKYKDISRKLVDLEVRYTLAKLMAQEVSE